MKNLILSALLAAGVLSAAASLWLVAALALSRWRGRQVAKWLRDHEAPEWPERPMPRRKVQVQFNALKYNVPLQSGKRLYVATLNPPTHEN